MEDLIHISPLGTIRVLGVPFGSIQPEALDILGKQNVTITRCWQTMIDIDPHWGYQNLPKIHLVSFRFDGESKALHPNSDVTKVLRSVYISIGGLSNVSVKKYLEYLKSVFSRFYVEDNTDEKITLFDTLYTVRIAKGFNKEFETHRLSVTVEAKYCDDKLIRYEYVSKEYLLPKDAPAILLTDKPKRIERGGVKIGNREFAIIIVVIYLLAMMYLYALNNRYYVVNANAIIDKWTTTLLVPDGDGGYRPYSRN